MFSPERFYHGDLPRLLARYLVGWGWEMSRKRPALFGKIVGTPQELTPICLVKHGVQPHGHTQSKNGFSAPLAGAVSCKKTEFYNGECIR
jgi:hypothetical protein